MSLHDQMTALTESFVKDLLDLLSQGSLSDLSGLSSAPGPVPVFLSGLAPSGRLARRSPKEIASRAEKIATLLKKRPEGARSEEIRAALGIDRKELPRPLAFLLAAKRVRTKGEKRATTYFLNGEGAAKKPKSVAGKKPSPAKKKVAPAKKPKKTTRPLSKKPKRSNVPRSSKASKVVAVPIPGVPLEDQ
jgi:hypothetical protein